MSTQQATEALKKADTELGASYGDYAGFTTDASPYLIEAHGEDPHGEVRRLLAQSITAESKILDVGCGPGHTLCKFASDVAEAWGIDPDEGLLEAAELRAKAQGLSNVTLIQGSFADETDLAALPDNYFDIAFCESGPGLSDGLVSKLAEDAIFLQEIGGNFSSYQLHEIMGRKPHTYYSYGADYSDQVLLSEMAARNFVPISFKNYFYEWYFRDIEHLEAQLRAVPWQVGDWRMGDPLPYEPERDRPALELYVKYNRTAKGIRLQQHLRVFAWRRANVHFYPVSQ